MWYSYFFNFSKILALKGSVAMIQSKQYKHIWYNEKEINDGWYKNVPYTVGWYFSDEIEQLNGPYNTEKEANEALEAYIEYLH